MPQLILPNHIDEHAFRAAFPLPYQTRALSPWEAYGLGLNHKVQWWYFEEPFEYHSAKFGPICIPKGAITDAASVPLRLQSLIGRTDPTIIFASAPHDWLFDTCGMTEQPLGPQTLLLLDDQGLLEPGQTTRRLTFDQCNEVLIEAMGICGASKAMRHLVFLAVKNGGKKLWNAKNPPRKYRA